MAHLCGVLAMQGAYAKHCEVLARCGAPFTEVRSLADLRRCDRLILPGGESTTMYRLLQRAGLWQPLSERLRSGMPVLGTCAGMILLSRRIAGSGKDGERQQPCLAAIDLEIQRNAYGRQIASFCAELALAAQVPENPQFAAFVQSAASSSLPLLFIRAPLAIRWGPEVQVLLRYPAEKAICLQQGKILVSSFHPELSGNTLLHRYFLGL